MVAGAARAVAIAASQNSFRREMICDLTCSLIVIPLTHCAPGKYRHILLFALGRQDCSHANYDPVLRMMDGRLGAIGLTPLALVSALILASSCMGLTPATRPLGRRPRPSQRRIPKLAPPITRAPPHRARRRRMRAALRVEVQLCRCFSKADRSVRWIGAAGSPLASTTFQSPPLGSTSPHGGGMSRQLDYFASVAQIVILDAVDL
jgi:hypothetical protein